MVMRMISFKNQISVLYFYAKSYIIHFCNILYRALGYEGPDHDGRKPKEMYLLYYVKY